MHIIMGIPLQFMVIGIPIPIIVVMRVQHSCIISMVMPAMGFIVQTMPSLVISQVIMQVMTGTIMGIPIIIGFIIGMPPIIGMLFIIGICMAVIISILPSLWRPWASSFGEGSVPRRPEGNNLRQLLSCAFLH